MGGTLLNIGILARRSELKKSAAPAARGGVARARGTRYGPAVPPTLAPALGLALRAVRREAWLVAGGTLVSLLRRVLKLPALVFVWVLAADAALLAARQRPLDPFAPFEGVIDALTAPRVIAIAVGLWLVGTVAGAALRVAWISGAVPVLGGAMAGTPRGSTGFVEGVAYGFPRVLATALLALVAEIAALVFALALGAGALRGAVAAAGSGASPLLAAGAALALTLAIAVPLGVAGAADAAVARAALRGEGPGAALAAVARRFLARPATFVLAVLAFGLLGGVLPGAVEAFGSAATALVPDDAPGALAFGPWAMVAAAAAVAAAFVDVVWIGTISALAGAEDRRG